MGTDGFHGQVWLWVAEVGGIEKDLFRCQIISYGDPNALTMTLWIISTSHEDTKGRG